MNVLLLNPPAMRLMNPATFEPDLLPPKTWVPLGIAYLASSLRASGHAAEPYDLHDWEWHDIAELIAHRAPDIVGISCFTFGRANALRVAALARRVAPNAFVVMGGPHATLFPEHMLNHPAVDVVVRGQGEITIVALADCLARKQDLSTVHGIAFMRDGRVLYTPPRPIMDNLDGLPFPAYDTFSLAEYKSPEIPREYMDLTGTHVMTSRGCPFHCHFCSVNRLFNGKWAFRSPENVVDELELLRDTRGVRHVYFSDDLFALKPARAIAICKAMLERRLDMVWMAETRVDCVTGEMLRWMRKAGCYRVYYGVESGSPRILQSINKGFTVAQVREAFRLTHAAGLEPCCFLMVGNPGETVETIDETVQLIRDIQPATAPIMGLTTLLPGTVQYENARRQGIIGDEYWHSVDPPPVYTGEHDMDDLIYLQLRLAQGVSPEIYEHMRNMGLDENYFRLRRMFSGASRAARH
ncbi:MAG: radical SAM protein [Desulfovibrionaceae bacterium]